ncbi:MAG: hypothetical protein ACOYY2_14250 [Actinomycetota bacterium]
MTTPPEVRLVDEPDRAGRTTVTLLGSLAARLAVLHAASGADVVGALVAGIAAVGRAEAQTVDGARLHAALRAGRAGSNGERLWSALLVGPWTSAFPPSQVREQLRNDVALLLVDDLDATLDLPPIPAEPVGPAVPRPAEPTTAVDFMVGLRAWAAELVAAVDALAAPTLDGSVTGTQRAVPPTDGPLLR